MDNTSQLGATQAERKNRGTTWRSSFVVAVVLYLFITALCARLHLGELSPGDPPTTTWTSTAIDDFLSPKNGRPDLVFLGSSLMVTPLVAADADALDQRLDAPYHHRSYVFEKRFEKQTGTEVKTFNFAVPGEMPSDAYLITKFLLKDEKAPNLIVYGVGPRDFLDNLLPSAGATDPFTHLLRYGKLADNEVKLYRPDWQDRLSYDLGRISYLYGKKEDLSARFSRLTTRLLAPHLPLEFAPDALAIRQEVLSGYHSFAVEPDQCIVVPSRIQKGPRFKDNIEEYRTRYRALKRETYNTQMASLGKTIDVANQRHIDFVIVSMPITQANRDLISESVWHLYKDGLRDLANSKGATFIDLEATHAFPQSDFGDTVHLNAVGGTRLLNALAEQLSAKASTIAAQSSNTKTVPGTAQIAGLKDKHSL